MKILISFVLLLLMLPFAAKAVGEDIVLRSAGEFRDSKAERRK